MCRSFEISATSVWMDFLSLARSEATDELLFPLEAVVVGDDEDVESSPFAVLPVLLAVLVDPDGALEAVVVGAGEDVESSPFAVLLVLLAVLVDPEDLSGELSTGVLEAVVVGAGVDAERELVLLAVLVDPDGVLEAVVVGTGEDEVLLPVLLAVLVDPDGVLEAVVVGVEEDDVVTFLSAARSDLYAFSLLVMSFFKAVLSPTSFLISDFSDATIFCSFFRSAVTVLMVFLS